MRRRATAALAALCLALAGAAPVDDELARDVEALGAPATTAREAALGRLAAGGDAAAEAVLEGFRAAPPVARRGRAEVLRRAGGAAHFEAAAALLDDVDPSVTDELLRFLSRPDLAGQGEGVRAAAFRDAAEAAPTAALRARAVEALGALATPGAADALDGLLDRLLDEEQTAVAEALAGLPAGRAAVLRRVRAAAEGVGPLGAPALAALLPDFGEALADAPRAADPAGRAAALAPLLTLRRHPDPRVRDAAVEGRGKLLDRLVTMGRTPELLDALDLFVAKGWDRREADLRLGWLALTRGPDPTLALAPARRLARTPGAPADDDARVWRLHGHLFEAAALVAARRPTEAHASLDEAARLAEGLAQQRLDLRPDPTDPSPRFGSLAVDRAHLTGVVSLLRAAALLAEGLAPSDLRVLEAARAAHAASLEAHLLRRRSAALAAAGNLDPLLDRDFAPRRLFLSNGRSAAWSAEEKLGLRRGLLDALASVAPRELPGLSAAPALPAWLADPLRDPERRALYEAIHLAGRADLDRREIELADRRDTLLREGRPFDDPAFEELALELGRLDWMRNQLEEAIDAWRSPPAGAEPDLDPLRELRGPSAAALVLATDLRTEGEPRAAIDLAEGMLAALDRPEYDGLEWFRAWTGGRLGICIGGAYSDEDLPREAEAALLDAVARIESLENSIASALDDLRAGGAAVDPVQLRTWEADLRRTERLRAQALTSLAVNANVKQNDVETAVAYFERGYELDQSDFMKVLRACYRARVGRDAEARAMLLEVPVAPDLYYNMACTWALLDEPAIALDYLTRELAENHPTPGSHERQREWARDDPDLAALRDDPRFQRLVDTPLRAPE